MNFLMFKLVLEKAEEPEIKLPTSTGSKKKQGNSRKKIYFCFMTIHILPFKKKKKMSFPFRPPQSIEQSSLSHTVGSHQGYLFQLHTQVAFTLYFNIIFLMKSEPFPGRGVRVGDRGAAPTALNPHVSRKNMRQRQACGRLAVRCVLPFPWPWVFLLPLDDFSTLCCCC